MTLGLRGVRRFALLVWVVGCGSSSSGTPGGAGGGGGAGALGAGGGDPTTPDGFCRGYYAIVVDLFVRCDGVSAAGAQALFTDPSGCQRYVASVAAHRSSFDGTRTAACLDELRAAFTCNSSSSSPAQAPDCAAVGPLVPVGGTCKSFGGLLPIECVGGSYCKRGPNQACDGTCTAFAAANQPCDRLNDVRCAPNFICDSVSKTCLTAPTPVGMGASCDSNTPCASGLYCATAADGGSAAPGTCQPRKSSGPCASSVECAQPAFCSGAPGAKTCAAPKHAGDSCTPDQLECDLASFCGADHKCSATYAAVGEPCGLQAGSDPVACATGAYCDGPILGSGTCRAVKPPGDTCTGTTSQLECSGNEAHCDATTHQCVACAF
jgi:hypothetical protein